MNLLGTFFLPMTNTFLILLANLLPFQSALRGNYTAHQLAINDSFIIHIINKVITYSTILPDSRK